MLYKRLFPQLAHTNWAYVDLNALAKLVHFISDPDFDPSAPQAAIAKPNPFFDPTFVPKLVRMTYDSLHCSYSYGGYSQLPVNL